MNTITISGPEDLVALVPYSLGFHPEDSVVMLTLDPVRFQARVDIPPPGQRHELVRHLVDMCARYQVEQVALLGYGDLESGVVDALVSLAGGLDDARVHVMSVLRIHEGRWYLPHEPADAGTAYDLTSHPLTLAAVVSGREVLSSRGELRRRLLAADPEEQAEIERLAWREVEALGARLDGGPSQLGDEMEWLRSRIEEYGRDAAMADLEDAALILVLINMAFVRSQFLADVTRDDLRGTVPFWFDLARRAPAPLTAAAAAVLALAAWLDGNGALAWCAVDRCREFTTEDLLVESLADALTAGLSPEEWDAAA